MVTGLNALLPKQIENLKSFDTPVARVLSATTKSGQVALICPLSEPNHSNQMDDLGKGLWDVEGTCVWLDSGTSPTARIKDVLEQMAKPDTPKQPVLCILDNHPP